MKISVKVSGLKELDKALAELPKAAAKSTLLRVAKKAAQPIADAAEALAPVDTGELKGSIIVTARAKNTVGNAEYSAIMRAGGSRSDARAAKIAATRADPGKSFAVVYVGPSKAKKKKDAIKRIVQEFGSVNMQANPYMRPAWDAHKDQALNIIRRELGNEIIATAKRIGKSKAARYTADIKYRASLAAMMAAEAE